MFKKLDSRAVLPAYQTPGASGFDFYAIEDTWVQFAEVAVVRTGLAVQIPLGCEIQVRARSGLAAKHGLFLVNGLGTIDEDYRGEIQILLSCCKRKPYLIRSGERIAQGVLIAVERAPIRWTEEISETKRGSGGFGSTGLRKDSTPLTI